MTESTGPIVDVIRARLTDRGAMRFKADVIVHLEGGLSLELRDVAGFEKGSSRWTNFPARPELDEHGQKLTGPDGRVTWRGYCDWPTGTPSALREKFSADIWAQALELLGSEGADEGDDDDDLPF